LKTVVQKSLVAAPPAEVWARAVSPEGINHELSPFLRMTMPRSIRGRTIDDVPVGVPLGKSWLLLFGFLPVDFDDLSLAERGPGLRFLERSSMLTMSLWQHERTIEPEGDGANVTDRLSFELRRPMRWIPGFHAFAARTVAFLFRHRHRRLAEQYGPAAGDS
jgi:ligand-binding SRPBCC domain-containing protein